MSSHKCLTLHTMLNTAHVFQSSRRAGAFHRGRFARTACLLLATACPSSGQSQITAWGDNALAQCNVPSLPIGAAYAQIDAGMSHSVAIRSDGVGLAWGDNAFGQCNVPTLPMGITYSTITAGWNHSVACRSDGWAVAWGDNSYGQCDVPSPSPGVHYSVAAGGYHHTFALFSDGSAIAWGGNGAGQCNVPPLPSATTYTAIAAGQWHSVALRSDGVVRAWGVNVSGQCTVPVLPSGLVYTRIAAGSRHTVALRSDGALLAWGDNVNGQCNVTQAPAGSHYIEIAAAFRQTIAVRNDGLLAGWGDNTFGELSFPALPAGQGFVAAAPGSVHTLGIHDTMSVTAYCTSSTSTNDCVANIYASGIPSASASSGFTVAVAALDGNRTGNIFYGLGATSTPWFVGSTSVLCVIPPHQRTTNLNSGGTTGSCDGLIALDWNAWRTTHPAAIGVPFAAGSAVYFQGWFRDPAAPKNTNLSNALRAVLQP